LRKAPVVELYGWAFQNQKTAEKMPEQEMPEQEMPEQEMPRTHGGFAPLQPPANPFS
jgi:hypothetical protein